MANSRKFGLDFWLDLFRELDYPVKVQEFPLALLREQKILPRNTNPLKVTRLFNNDLMDVVVIEVKNEEFSRGRCVGIARSWKRNNLLSPVVVLTNSSESYVSIIPGVGYNSEAKILYLSDELYHTDKLVLQSMKYVEDKVELLKLYNNAFFPYKRVRDDFFYQYRDIFQELLDKLAPYMGNHTRSFAQKFLGRLMFLYFLQKKGWLKGNKRFVENIKDYRGLSNLYYNGLNTGKIEGIPFLNGSLFDREDYLTREKEEEIADILNEAFLKARKFFDDYNFTVDETAPLEVEVSIDPALSGTVFENLLLEKERGEKGTFYTPKDEISFICRRALVRYLGLQDRYTPDNKSMQDGIELYLEDLRKSRKIDEIRNLKERLLKVRVVDPAVGSGGFLVVMMQEIVSIVTEADSIAGWKSDPYEYKKAIHRNLFGFDVEPEAVEIARLRMWLSMIIDQDVPVPLPNLDFKIVDIPDSLELQSVQKKITPEIEEERDHVEKLIEQYSNEHDNENKRSLKKRIASHTENLRKYGLNPEVIESYMVNPADIVVMNPPYVRQESIQQERKKYYTDTYKFNKKSDLYVYFFQRALWLLKPNGYVSVISSDKWLETSYGEKLQSYLKSRLIAIFGQRNRSFEADINTVISIYGNDMQSDPVDFTYLENYASKNVIRRIPMGRPDLRPGKWFYLRAPEFFLKEIMPKLTHKLGDFAEIKRGFTTGANEFFYMKDVSGQYEADYLSNPKRFEEWGVSARDEKELKEQGLIYMENEGGEKFVIEKRNTDGIIRSPKQLGQYNVPVPKTLCLMVNDVKGVLTQRYIKYGENNGFHKRPTTKNRNPWFQLPEFKPTKILLPKSLMDVIYIPFSAESVRCDDRFYGYYYPKSNIMSVWLYLNSSIFYIILELYSRRLGGGAVDTMVDDYREMPCPDLSTLSIQFDPEMLLDRKPLIYYKEKENASRLSLDTSLLRILGFGDSENLALKLRDAWPDVVDDRLIKADRPLKRKGNDQDN